MKKLFLILTLLLMNGIANAQASMPTNIITLNGTWDLYENARGIGKKPDQSMNIMTFDENRIVVQGITMGSTYWIGLGKVDGDSGYFDWRFDDGTYGQTTFKVNQDGSLDALSIGIDNGNYKYLAKKRRK